MKRWFLFLTLSLSLCLTACGADTAMPFTVTITPERRSPQRVNSPEALVGETAAASATADVSPTPTLAPSLTATITLTVPPPTETLLPPLEMPTEKPNAPSFVVWTGEPSYAGDSEPGRLFRVNYDPDIWAQTKDNFEQVVLANRNIEYCTITPWSGRGLPADAKVEHIYGQVGDIPYDINYVTMAGSMKFATYVGGDQRLLTGFQVSFVDQKEQCLLDAEAILASLRSFIAEPTITPTFTPEPLESATPTP